MIVAPDEVPKPAFKQRFQFGNQAFSLDIADHESGFAFTKPVVVTLIYSASDNSNEESKRAPGLRLFINDTWELAEDTCLPPWGPGVWIVCGWPESNVGCTVLRIALPFLHCLHRLYCQVDDV